MGQVVSPMPEPIPRGILQGSWCPGMTVDTHIGMSQIS